MKRFVEAVNILYCFLPVKILIFFNSTIFSPQRVILSYNIFVLCTSMDLLNGIYPFYRNYTEHNYILNAIKSFRIDARDQSFSSIFYQAMERRIVNNIICDNFDPLI